MSISFARVAGTSTTYAATNAYTAVSGVAPTATPSGNLGGPELSDYQLLHLFTKPYLDAHTLSFPSWRYAYYFWFVLIGLFAIWVAFHQLHLRGGALGASLRKLGMRKINFGGRQKAAVASTSTSGNNAAGKPKRSWSSPTVSQLVGLVILLGFTFCMCYIGPDFINPRECMFGGECEYVPVNGDGASNQFAKRRQARYGWSVLEDTLLAGPNFTINKNYWVSSSRVGLIAYAFLPLSVALALKQWPMNIFATPFFTNLHIDKTLFWHKWVGRIIWALSTVHAGLWTKQLTIDLNPFNEPTWNSSWKWHRLLAGGISYILLTIMVLFSIKPFRTRYYEIFYYSHVLLVLGFLVTIIIHYQALQGWGLLAACLWGLERLVRSCVFLWLNYGSGIPVFGEGRIGKAQFSSRTAQNGGGFRVHNVEKRLSADAQKYAATPNGPYGNEEWSAASRSTQNLQDTIVPMQSRQPVSAYGQGNDTPREGQQPLPYGAGPYAGRPPFDSPNPSYFGPGANAGPAPLMRPTHRMQAIPKGYALAQVLPGRVLKLTLHTPRHLNWKPGQHIQLTIPSIRWWQSHPYTIAAAQNLTESSLAKNRPAGEQAGGSEITLIMSTRKGFTRRLYNSIVDKRKQLVSSDASYSNDKGDSSSGANGVLIRAQTYLPSGSAARAHWDDFSTVILVAAGTGITYALSVLEHLCFEMAAKDAALRGEEPGWSRGKKGKAKKPTNVNRVRFVWILREYAHLAWIAPALRRCLDISDPARLRIDLFVTRELAQIQGIHPSQQQQRGYSQPNTPSAFMSETKGDEVFAPPQPRFARHGGRSGSMDSDRSDLSQTVVDAQEYSNGGYGGHAKRTSVSMSGNEIQHPPQHEQDTTADFSVTDMILFDGEEEDPPTAADEEISKKVRKEGKIRRALSRKRKGISESGQPLTSAAAPVPKRRSNLAPASAAQNDYSDMSGDEASTPTRFLPQQQASSPHMYPPPAGRFNADSRRGSAHSYTHHLDDQDVDSLKGNFTPYGRPASTPGLPLLRQDDLTSYDMDEYDREDLDVIAELARGGRPDLEDILDAEINRSQGKVAVGCCGPVTLNNHVRAMVASRISPGKIAKGDSRGNIELIAEDFSF